MACAAGIYVCYLRYGLLQERIYATAFGDGEHFRYSGFLVAVQCTANAAVAAAVLLAGGNGLGVGWPALPEYMGVSLSYLSAMLFSFTALGHMSYPMQALGKSCKMIPVMLMGIVIRKKVYSAREFCAVGLITVGVAMFSWKGGKSSVATSPLGAALLFMSLFMDGVTGPMQERLVARHKPSTHMLMFGQNLCSVAWLAVGLVVTGEGARALAFVTRFPAVMPDILLFAAVSAIGQNFIFYTVRNFSALAVTTITTTRKMFTVLLSIFVFNHSMVPRQWLGLVLVFAAITLEAAAKQRAKKAAATPAVPATLPAKVE